MVHLPQFKEKVKSIIAPSTTLEFLGKELDLIVEKLSEIQAEKIYQWLTEVQEKAVQPILVGSKKSYKEWNLNQLLVFRYPLNIDNHEYRILLVKVKNSWYIEFHLGDHKYYDRVRKDLDLKRSGY